MEKHGEPSRTLRDHRKAVEKQSKTVEEENSAPEDSKHSGSGTIESPSRSTAFSMQRFLWRTNAGTTAITSTTALLEIYPRSYPRAFQVRRSDLRVHPNSTRMVTPESLSCCCCICFIAVVVLLLIAVVRCSSTVMGGTLSGDGQCGSS